MTRCVHLLILGKVQGVFFRASAKKKADNLGIKGWVENTPQGDVAICATGERIALEEFINWCRKGPSDAVVTGLTVSEKAIESFKEFSIIGS